MFINLLASGCQRLKFNPIMEITLGPLGVNGSLSLNLFNRDTSNLIVVFVDHVYDRYCSILEGDVVIDCGAYIGEFTLQAAKKVGDEGLVIAFEPNPRSFSICKSNVERNNLRNVELFQCALGEKRGRSFLDVNQRNLGATKVVAWSPAHSNLPTEVNTLSEFGSHLGGRNIKLLKLDVEGFATRIVQGGDLLFRNNRILNVVAELHPGEEDLQQMLEGHGFTCNREKDYLYGKLANASSAIP